MTFNIKNKFSWLFLTYSFIIMIYSLTSFIVHSKSKIRAYSETELWFHQIWSLTLYIMYVLEIKYIIYFIILRTRYFKPFDYNFFSKRTFTLHYITFGYNILYKMTSFTDWDKKPQAVLSLQRTAPAGWRVCLFIQGTTDQTFIQTEIQL